MKGLILHELYTMKYAYAKNLLLVGVLYAALTFAMRMEFFAYMMIWMMGFYAVGSVSLDAGWSRFSKALPVRPGQLAGARFAGAAAMQLLGVAYAMVLGAAMCAVNGGSYGEYLQVVALVTAIAFSVTCILLPCSLKWGVDKARNALMLVFVAFFGGIVLISRSYDLSGLEVWLENSLEGVLAVSAAAVLAICAVCWRAPAGIYEKKEF